MAKMRVHDLAKEYGMQSKELLEHLADMKIPAKSASSTLEDAYISIVRKKLQPIMQQRLSDLLQRQGVRLSVQRKRRSAQKRRLLARKKRSAAALRKRRSVLRPKRPSVTA